MYKTIILGYTTMIHSSNLINEAKELRTKGHSYNEISKKLSIAKSTSYLWVNKIELNVQAKAKLKKKKIIARLSALEALRKKRELIKDEIIKKANKLVTQISINTELAKLLCSLLYWAEGAKSDKSLVTFINSDSNMVLTFLKLFRCAFALDEKKFRGLIHVHEYHNETEIKKYWASITNIPLSQFQKSYIKSHTKIRIRNDYKGTISIRYYDYKIALELYFIYNRFAKTLVIEGV